MSARFEGHFSDRRKSPCPFLTCNQFSFLKEISYRADANMYESPAEEFNDIRNMFLRAGYTDAINQQFQNMMRSPETLERDALIPILSLLYGSFSFVREDRIERYESFCSDYKILRGITYIGAEGSSGEFIAQFRRAHENVHDFARIIQILDNVLERLKAIISPPESAKVIQLNPL